MARLVPVGEVQYENDEPVIQLAATAADDQWFLAGRLRRWARGEGQDDPFSLSPEEAQEKLDELQSTQLFERAPE